MPEAFINRIATTNPPHGVHDVFIRFGQLMLKDGYRCVALVAETMMFHMGA